ncbi:MAG TPA: hypothetical protein VM689_17290 [Aliidongia sp.]|nr:hypothetical protein [Aliidongia sp.]
MKQLSAEAGWSSVEHRFETGHPTAEGHFPGIPIIPGALLLDHALRAISAGPASLRMVKFLRPVRPGEPIEIRWRATAGEVAFECRNGSGEPALVGALILPLR